MTDESESTQGKGQKITDSTVPQPEGDMEPTRKPSQAEGDRETIEEDLHEKEAEGAL